MLTQFIRKCPKCQRDLIYSSYKCLWRATKKNSMCLSCVHTGMLANSETRDILRKIRTGKVLTLETKKKLSKRMVGKNNPFFGKKHNSNSIEKMSKPRSMESRHRMRISAINRIKTRTGQIIPNYNPEACKKIDEYGKLNGYNFQHAENGGEFYIKDLGYWVDGYDKEKNVVIEYNELYHNKSKIKERDLYRLDEIRTRLNCDIIVINESQ